MNKEVENSNIPHEVIGEEKQMVFRRTWEEFRECGKIKWTSDVGQL